MNKTTIEIDPIGGATVTVNENGIEKQKNISYEDLERIFCNNMNISTGILPQRCVYYEKGDVGYFAILQVNSGVIDASYHRRGDTQITRYRVPIPYTYFGVVVKNTKIVFSGCVCAEKLFTDLNIPIFRYPYGNVFADTRICWGANQLPDIPQPRFLSNIPDLFFNAPYNGDLFEDIRIRNVTYSHAVDLLTGLDINKPANKANTIYPTGAGCLNRHQSGIRTMNDFVAILKRNLR